MPADPPARPPQGAQRERRGRRQGDASVRASCTRRRLVRRRRLPRANKGLPPFASSTSRSPSPSKSAAAIEPAIALCGARREGAVARVEQHSAGTAIVPKQHVEVAEQHVEVAVAVDVRRRDRATHGARAIVEATVAVRRVAVRVAEARAAVKAGNTRVVARVAAAVAVARAAVAATAAAAVESALAAGLVAEARAAR